MAAEAQNIAYYYRMRRKAESFRVGASEATEEYFAAVNVVISNETNRG